MYIMYVFQFAYKDGFEYMKTTLETEELDAPVSYCRPIFLRLFIFHDFVFMDIFVDCRTCTNNVQYFYMDIFAAICFCKFPFLVKVTKISCS